MWQHGEAQRTKDAQKKATENANKLQQTLSEANISAQSTEETLAAAQKELEELKAKGVEVRDLTQEETDALVAGAMEQARAADAKRMQALEKQLAQADPDTAS